MTDFTDQELMALHQGIVKVDLSHDVISAADKVQAELEARGYEIKYAELTYPGRRKKYHEYQYIKA